MTPKEKAEELFLKFRHNMLRKQAIDCALICVDEIVEQWEYVDTYIADLNGKLNPNLKYWIEVKQELNKL